VTLALRLLGMLVAGVAGWQLGVLLAGSSGGDPPAGDALRYVLVLALAASALGLLLAPYATVVPLRRLSRAARTAAAADLLGGTAGLIAGLLIAALAAYPISLLPHPLGGWLPAAVAVLLAWLGTAVGISRKDELLHALWERWSAARQEGGLRGAVLLDTSAIVDGRIVEVRQSGFIGGDLHVPRFVLEELQQLADSGDPARRQRGRRGLDMLERLKERVNVEVPDTDYLDLRGVDSKLIRLALQTQAAIVTTDYTLNRIASLQGVPVLNVNDLASALKPVVVPGEELTVEVVQEGRERKQGVAFLDDGTMVVVEGGRSFVGQRIGVEVSRVLPTAGGRIVFARVAASTEAEEAADAGTRAGRDVSRLRVIRGAGEETAPADTTGS
jgi:uncharacterized protein YacL